MNFAELEQEVQLWAKRPELATQVKAAIRASTLKLHQSRYWHRDLVELTIAFDSPRYIQSFIPKEVVPLYRKPKYLRWFSGIDGDEPGDFYTKCDLDNILDGYGYEKSNIWYLSGNMMQIKSTVELHYALFGCYQSPKLLPEEQFTSWIAEDYPYAIVHEATRLIFKSIGRDEQAVEQNNLAREYYMTLVAAEGNDETPT